MQPFLLAEFIMAASIVDDERLASHVDIVMAVAMAICVTIIGYLRTGAQPEGHTSLPRIPMEVTTISIALVARGLHGMLADTTKASTINMRTACWLTIAVLYPAITHSYYASLPPSVVAAKYEVLCTQAAVGFAAKAASWLAGGITGCLCVNSKDRHSIAALILWFNFRLGLQAYDLVGDAAGAFAVYNCVYIAVGYATVTALREAATRMRTRPLATASSETLAASARPSVQRPRPMMGVCAVRAPTQGSNDEQQEQPSEGVECNAHDGQSHSEQQRPGELVARRAAARRFSWSESSLERFSGSLVKRANDLFAD